MKIKLLPLHVKLDTGMGRIGIREKRELQELENLIISDKRFMLEGVFTHFATADEIDTAYFYQQFDRFKEMISMVKSISLNIFIASNSAAALRFPMKRALMLLEWELPCMV